jgi:Complex 1 protein (LYR family)
MRPSLRLLIKPTATTTRQTPRSRLGPPLSLDHFLQRQRVLSLYRTIIRSLYRIPKDGRAEPISWARGEFERNKDVSDITQIRYLISTGKTEFEGMARYIDELAAK